MRSLFWPTEGAVVVLLHRLLSCNQQTWAEMDWMTFIMVWALVWAMWRDTVVYHSTIIGELCFMYFIHTLWFCQDNKKDLLLKRKSDDKSDFVFDAPVCSAEEQCVRCIVFVLPHISLHYSAHYWKSCRSQWLRLNHCSRQSSDAGLFTACVLPPLWLP